MQGTVAIINEFGAIGLDHLLVETTEERFALLDNGCVCCTVRGDLAATLAELLDRPMRVERVVLETTGLADPAPILHTLMADPALAGRYRVDAVLTTVDAVNGMATLNVRAEAMKQVAIADRLLVTKADLADAADLRHRLATINPQARILMVRDGEVPADELVGLQADWRVPPACCDDHGHHHRDHHHDHDIESYSFVIDQPVERAAFFQWLDYLAALKGEDLLRLKGLVHLAGDPDRPLVVHGVQHVFHPPRQLDAWPDADRRSRLVFIVRGIPRAVIERTLVRFGSVDAARIRRPAA
jgi:G3E family GTPase